MPAVCPRETRADLDGAACRLAQSHEDADERRFPRAVLADESVDATRLEIEVNGT